MPQMFQQALWFGGTDQEDEGQEVDFAQVDDRGWARGVSEEPRKCQRSEYLRSCETPAGCARFPNPEETILPLFEFAELIKEDYETRGDGPLVRRR